MSDDPLDLDRLQTNVRQMIEQMREASASADPELCEGILSAAAQLESDTPEAIREYVDGMANAERMLREAEARNRESEERLRSYARDAEQGFPSVVPTSLEELEPLGWKDARSRLLERLKSSPPPQVTPVDLKDWAYDSVAGSSVASPMSSSAAIADSGSTAVPSASIGGAKGWSDWIAGSQSMTPTPTAEPTPAENDKAPDEPAQNNPWLKAWKPRET